MADGFATKRYGYERRCYNLLPRAVAYRLDHRGDHLFRCVLLTAWAHSHRIVVSTRLYRLTG